MRTFSAIKFSICQRARTGTERGFRSETPALETYRKTIPSQNRRKTLQDCKEAIISHIRANPKCHTSDLVKIARSNNIRVKPGSINTALSIWKKQDPTIPKRSPSPNRKTLSDCKELLIAHIRANPKCHAIDLVKIARSNNVRVKLGSIYTALYVWRKQDPTIPKLSPSPKRKRVSVIYPIRDALVTALKQHQEWNINDAVGFCRKHRRRIQPGTLQTQLRKMRENDPSIPKLKPVNSVHRKDGTRRLGSAKAEIIFFITEQKEGCTMDELLRFVHTLGIKTEKNGLKVRLSQWRAKAREEGWDIPYLK